MSTTTVSYSETTEDVRLEELREREERAREALRRRLGAAERAVAEVEARHARVVATLDAARAELPDLVYVAPALPAAPFTQDPAEVEQHLVELDYLADRVEREAYAAIDTARVLLERRRQLAQAWTRIQEALAEIELRNQSCRELAARLHESFAARQGRAPRADCSLEEAQYALAELGQIAGELRVQHTGFERRLRTRAAARALGGDRVSAAGASERLDEWRARKAEEAESRARRSIDGALQAAQLSRTDLPEALRMQIDYAIGQAVEMDRTRQVIDLVNRHRARLDGVERASQLLARPPQYADGHTGAMLERWRNLVARLEAVLYGQAEWSESLELEHGQVHDDCARAVQRAYARAGFLEAALDSGFQIAEGAGDLVLMDIDGYPGYYLAVEEQETPDGFATKVELLADREVASIQDAAVTDVVCRQLEAMARSKDKSLDCGIEVLERKAAVTRARRPGRRPRATRAMASDPSAPR